MVGQVTIITTFRSCIIMKQYFILINTYASQVVPKPVAMRIGVEDNQMTKVLNNQKYPMISEYNGGYNIECTVIYP